MFSRMAICPVPVLASFRCPFERQAFYHSVLLGFSTCRRASQSANFECGQQISTGPRDGLKSRGFFITLEGIDGSGKTTQFKRLIRHLRRRGYKVRATREPGGTPVGERVRAILLADKEDLSPLTELALFYAARTQHIENVIRPALQRSEVVVSDRFNDCSFVYQGYGRR